MLQTAIKHSFVASLCIAGVGIGITISKASNGSFQGNDQIQLPPNKLEIPTKDIRGRKIDSPTWVILLPKKNCCNVFRHQAGLVAMMPQSSEVLYLIDHADQVISKSKARFALSSKHLEEPSVYSRSADQSYSMSTIDDLERDLLSSSVKQQVKK